ncbi:MAG: SurA N-terminal domain-containing protein [Paludibacteraceae bacterium]|nr:SurA N-terminal domain-containing protein [Paludibacteraceae bacterium]
MATLQRIRNHGLFLLIIVGLAMLAFILGDALNSGSSFMNKSREYIGEIEGQKIHYTEYESAVEQLTEVYKIESGRSDFDEDMHAQIRNQVWQMLVAKYTLQDQAKQIGMDITSDELYELCAGAKPHQLITSRRMFAGQNGQFDRNILINFLASIEMDSENAEQAANLKQAKNYWMYWENAVRLTAMQEKYVGLIQNMLTANNLDAKYASQAKQTKVNVDYAMKPYYTVADSLVKVSTNDIRKIYDERKQMYKQTPNRDIAYIAYPIVPSEADYQLAEKAMQEIQEEFRTTEEVALVVNSNSDVMYDGNNYSEKTIPAAYKDFAFAKGAKKNDFMELNYDEATRTFRMARLMDCGYNSPDSVQLKGIATKEGEQDQEYGWFTEAELQKDIAEPAFAGKVGQRFTVTLGMEDRTFEITGLTKPTPKAKVAIIEREVTPSSKTFAAIYNEANQFVVNNQDEEAFRAAAEEAKMEIETATNLQKMANKVADLKSSRAIVRWAFNAKEGQVSDVFECGDKYIVAVLTATHDGEYREFEDVQATLRYEAVNRKKAEYISKQIADAKTLAEVAEKMGSEVRHIDALTEDSYRFGIEGMEPAAVGTAFATAAGELSKPVKGNQGVIVLVPSDVQRAEAEVDYKAEIASLNARTSYSLPYQLINNLEQNADIVDNRATFQ